MSKGEGRCRARQGRVEPRDRSRLRSAVFSRRRSGASTLRNEGDRPGRPRTGGVRRMAGGDGACHAVRHIGHRLRGGGDHHVHPRGPSRPRPR
ncbi:hypothetical protein SBD_6791 [Streptomyces bottropensis ATCC 25435]|uniref:Uncharacterized protein n=1 Tax=Streptomyces bottropensis ATCC 25435 TaxID=1054862 RepID=M3D7R6_9ACTN|nr:hypothetical protein SBD_6791 [Streptomyces bottropensis ATCC 25435]